MMAPEKRRGNTGSERMELTQRKERKRKEGGGRGGVGGGGGVERGGDGRGLAGKA